MGIKDTLRGKILWHKYVRHETVAGYVQGVEWLEEHGFTIHGIVCDGLRGLFKALSRYGLLVKMGGEIFVKADIYLPLHHLLLI